MRDLTVPFRLLILIPAVLEAQGNPGSDVLTGRVTDLTGRPVVEAQVGATSRRTGVTRSHVTDVEGRYKIYFPETAPEYTLLVKRMGFSPVQRTITRRTTGPEEITVDIQFGGAPLALSVVEISGSDPGGEPQREPALRFDATVPNPVSEILALKDTLHLTAVQIVGLGDIADTLQATNSRIYRNIRLLLAKSQEAGDATLMAGSVALLLEEASGNTARAMSGAGKLLRQEQRLVLSAEIRDQLDSADGAQVSVKR
jgi:hypothetical protein